MRSYFDDDTIRTEFSEWINCTASELQESEDKGNLERKYYVYALCELTNDGSFLPFYIGKGSGDRVWHHSDETEKEKEEILEEAKKYGYTDKEIEQFMDTITEKHKRINEVGKERLKSIIIKSGLTEYESLMCESALINLLKMDSVRFFDNDQLTNKQNGHSNPFEKMAGIETSALLVEDYFNCYCKKPIIYNDMTPDQREVFKDKKILLRNINNTYLQCINPLLFPTAEEQNDAIREAVRGFWNEGDLERMDYVFAMYEGRIKGIYKVIKQKDNNLPHVYDLWRDDYPKMDKLPIRKEEYDFAKAIYDDLVSQNYIDETHPGKELTIEIRNEMYSKLKNKTQLIVRNSIEESKYKKWFKQQLEKEVTLIDNNNTRERFYNWYLRKWSIKKYYVLEDIKEAGEADLLNYLNCSIKEKRNGRCDSILAGDIMESLDNKTKRAFSKIMRYLSPSDMNGD